MFKIIAVVVIGIFGGIGFFDLGRAAYTLAALLLGTGALLDYSQKRTAAKEIRFEGLPASRDGWAEGHSASPKAAPVDSR